MKIIQFHEENLNDFSEHEYQESFHHNNDKSDDEGIAVPTSPHCKITNNLGF